MNNFGRNIGPHVDAELAAASAAQAQGRPAVAFTHLERAHVLGQASNRLRSPAAKAETVAGFQRDWLPAFADGRLRPLIDSVFPMEQLDVAIAKMEQNQHCGKIVVRW